MFYHVSPLFVEPKIASVFLRVQVAVKKLYTFFILFLLVFFAYWGEIYYVQNVVPILQCLMNIKKILLIWNRY